MKDDECKIRIRMSEHDAHYGGKLVDGARILQLFGDVATELLIRMDGDEGLFRAYSSVDFLAPVRAGDYIEATGRVSKIGNTSRTMEFTAHKVIEAGGPHPGSAKFLTESILVCKAEGVCVRGPLED